MVYRGMNMIMLGTRVILILAILALLCPLTFPLVSAGSVTKTQAYVTTYDQNSLSIIDTASRSVVKTISVGEHPIGVAVSPDGKEAYVANSGSDSVTIIDTFTGDKTGDISVGISPQYLAFSPDGKYAYVACMGSGSVSVIDTKTKGVSTISNSTLNNARFIAISPDGHRAYVSTYTSGNLVVINLDTKAVISRISYIGANANVPGGIAVKPDSSMAYVVLAAHTTYPGDISAIDTALVTDSYNFSTGVSAEKWGVKYHPVQNLLYIANTQNNQVIVSNPAKTIRFGGSRVAAKIGTGTDPWDLEFSPDNSAAYVACRDSVTVIDTGSKTSSATILLPGFHQGIAVAAVNTYVPDPSPSPTPIPVTPTPVPPTPTPAEQSATVIPATVTPVVTVTPQPTVMGSTPVPAENQTIVTQSPPATASPVPADHGPDTSLYYIIGGLGIVIIALLLAVAILGGYVLGKKK